MNAEMQLLAKERDKTTFCVEELTYIIDGGKNKTQRRRKMGMYSCLMFMLVSLLLFDIARILKQDKTHIEQIK